MVKAANRAVFIRVIVLITIITGMIGVACTKKALPVITERKRETPPPGIKAADIQPDLVKGKRIFMNRCAGCHDLPKPQQFKAERWEGILSYMIPRAGLDVEQGVHVTAYLKENAAK